MRFSPAQLATILVVLNLQNWAFAQPNFVTPVQPHTCIDAALGTVERQGHLSKTEIRYTPWQGTPLSQLPGFTAADNPDSNSLILRIGGGGPGSSDLQATRSSLPALTSQAMVMQQLEAYGRALNQPQLLNAQQALVPRQEQQLARYNSSPNNGSGVLQRLGSARYFQFQPELASQYVSARILDIDLDRSDLKVLAEWIVPQQDKTLVGLLTTKELLSIQSSSTQESVRASVAADFEKRIAPNARAVQQAFARVNLPIMFSEETSDRSNLIPSSGYALFITQASTKIYPEESSQIDAYYRMANEPPSTTMMRNLKSEYTYNWIINEDGELQLSVHTLVNDSKHVPRPSLKMLSKGRGILIGGYLIAKDGRWQAVIDTDGGNYGVLSTQDVIIDTSFRGSNTVSTFHATNTKVPVVPYLNRLEDYVYLVQETFFDATGFIPEVSKYWKDSNLWHQPELSVSRAQNRPTTSEEAEALTSFGKYLTRQSKGIQLHENGVWNEQETLIENFNEDQSEEFNKKVSDINWALWALRINMQGKALATLSEDQVTKSYMNLIARFHPDALIRAKASAEEIQAAEKVMRIITLSWNTYKRN